MCVLFLSSFCVVLSSLLFPLCVFVCYVSVSIGSAFCVCSTVCLCVIPFSLCVLFMCVLYMCGVYLLLVCVSVCMCLLYVCVCYSCVYCVCVPIVSMCSLCMCITCVLLMCVPVSVSYVYVSVVSLCVPCICLFLCMYVVYVSTVFYVYCICYVYVCFSVVCLCCWLPCWCGVYHGGVMGACFFGFGGFCFLGGVACVEFFYFFIHGFVWVVVFC